PYYRNEDMRKAALVVVTRGGCRQGIVGGNRGHEHGHAGGDDERDGDDLPAHGAEIAQQLAVEQAHQLSSSGERRRAFFSSPTICPSRRRSTRSAMPAMASLWVMTMAVVPSSVFARAIAPSTSFPVS